MNNIEISAKVESSIVVVSAGLVAVGAAAVTASTYIPAPYAGYALGLGAALGTAGVGILAVWQKFVNVFHAEASK